VKSGIMKKTALDREFHKANNSTSSKLKALGEAKLELVSIASELDFRGEKDIANAIDEAIKELK